MQNCIAAFGGAVGALAGSIITVRGDDDAAEAGRSGVRYSSLDDGDNSLREDRLHDVESSKGGIPRLSLENRLRNSYHDRRSEHRFARPFPKAMDNDMAVSGRSFFRNCSAQSGGALFCGGGGCSLFVRESVFHSCGSKRYIPFTAMPSGSDEALVGGAVGAVTTGAMLVEDCVFRASWVNAVGRGGTSAVLASFNARGGAIGLMGNPHIGQMIVRRVDIVDTVSVGATDVATMFGGCGVSAVHDTARVDIPVGSSTVLIEDTRVLNCSNIGSDIDGGAISIYMRSGDTRCSPSVQLRNLEFRNIKSRAFQRGLSGTIRIYLAGSGLRLGPVIAKVDLSMIQVKDVEMITNGETAGLVAGAAAHIFLQFTDAIPGSSSVSLTIRNVTIEDALISSSRRTAQGTALYIYSAMKTLGNLTVDFDVRDIFIRNVTAVSVGQFVQGGAIYFLWSKDGNIGRPASAVLNIQNILVEDSSALALGSSTDTNIGGCMYLYILGNLREGDVSISSLRNVTLRRCIVYSESGSTAVTGGALGIFFRPELRRHRVEIDNIQLTNSSIVSAGEARGGGLYVAGDGLIFITNALFEDDAAVEGGGVVIANSVVAQISNCSIRRNSGGGIMFLSSKGVLQASVIEENSALVVGGGVYIASSSVVTLENVVLRDNVAPLGSAIATSDQRTNVILRDSFIEGRGNDLVGAIFGNSSQVQTIWSCRAPHTGAKLESFTGVKFSFECERCPTGTYSAVTATSSTLVQCEGCPISGICLDGALYATPAYWGLENPRTHTVNFIPLPEGYGCSVINNITECTYDYCSGGRDGVLCSKCKAGTGLVFFATGCKLEEECRDSIWGGAVLAGCGLVLALGLILTTAKSMRKYCLLSSDSSPFLHVIDAEGSEQAQNMMKHHSGEDPYQHQHHLQTLKREGVHYHYEGGHHHPQQIQQQHQEQQHRLQTLKREGIHHHHHEGEHHPQQIRKQQQRPPRANFSSSTGEVMIKLKAIFGSLPATWVSIHDLSPILVSFYQISSLIKSTPWRLIAPSIVGGIQAVFTLAPPEVIAEEESRSRTVQVVNRGLCLLRGMTTTQKIVSRLLLPAVTVCWIAILMLVIVVTNGRRGKNRRSGTAPRDEEFHSFSPRGRAFESDSPVRKGSGLSSSDPDTATSLQQSLMNQMSSSALRYVFAGSIARLLTIAYIIISLVVLQLTQCIDIEEFGATEEEDRVVSVLWWDAQVHCFESWQVGAITALCVVGCLPAILVALLQNSCSGQDTNCGADPSRTPSFTWFRPIGRMITSHYHPCRRWYLGVTLYERFFTAVVYSTSSDRNWRAFLMIFICSLSLTLQIVFKPFRHTIANTIGAASHVLLCFLCVSTVPAQARYQSGEGTIESDSQGIGKIEWLQSAIFALPILTVVSVMIVNMIVRVARSRRKNRGWELGGDFMFMMAGRAANSEECEDIIIAEAINPGQEMVELAPSLEKDGDHDVNKEIVHATHQDVESEESNITPKSHSASSGDGDPIEIEHHLNHRRYHNHQGHHILSLQRMTPTAPLPSSSPSTTTASSPCLETTTADDSETADQQHHHDEMFLNLEEWEPMVGTDHQDLYYAGVC